MRHARRRLLLAPLFVPLLGSLIGAAGAHAAAALDRELAAIAADPACPLASLSVLAIRAGQVSYARQFGQRFLGSGALPPKPANGDTLYRIASVSKMMTTLGAMMLVEQGKLDLDADIGTYLGYPLRNPHFPDQPIRLRHLLSHTSTLRDDAGYSWPNAVSLHSILVPGQARHGEGTMWSNKAAPGAYFCYCNLGWGVLGTLMEKVSGERFDVLMRRLLLDPLGLRGGYNPSAFPDDDLANLATLYRKRTVDTEVWNPAGPWIAQADDVHLGVHLRAPAPPAGIDDYRIGTNATPFSPTGGLRASAAGLGTVMQLLMNQGRHRDRQLLAPATLARMAAPQWTYDGNNGDNLGGLYYAWGLGLQLFPDRERYRLVEGGGFAGLGHLGEAYGLQSVFAADLAARNGMIVLVGGVGANPEAQPATQSAMARFEERILSALHRHALAGKY